MMTIQLTALCIPNDVGFSDEIQVVNKPPDSRAWPDKDHPNKTNLTNLKNLLTHEKIGFRCGLAIVLLDVFGLVGDHTDERVELKDGDAQIDDVHWVSKETLQCRNKLWTEEFMDTTYNIGFYTWWTFTVGRSSSFDNWCIPHYIYNKHDVSGNMFLTWFRWNKLVTKFSLDEVSV